MSNDSLPSGGWQEPVSPVMPVSPEQSCVPAWILEAPKGQQHQPFVPGFSRLSPAGVLSTFPSGAKPLKHLYRFESMFQKTAKSDCLDGKNVILCTVAYGDNFHITVTEGACVNATAQLQENSSGKWGCPVILWGMKIYIFFLGKGWAGTHCVGSPVHFQHFFYLHN